MCSLFVFPVNSLAAIDFTATSCKYLANIQEIHIFPLTFPGGCQAVTDCSKAFKVQYAALFSTVSPAVSLL